jgi:hypothetical protein
VRGIGVVQGTPFLLDGLKEALSFVLSPNRGRKRKVLLSCTEARWVEGSF